MKNPTFACRELRSVIDVGTNSVKFLVVRKSPDGSFETVVDKNNIVRLGEGLRDTGRISSEALERNALAIDRFVAEAEELEAPSPYIVGTMALRSASNAGEFVELVKKRTGVEIHVISGEEEARLSYMAVASEFVSEGAEIVSFDTGGGSTEFVHGISRRPANEISRRPANEISRRPANESEANKEPSRSLSANASVASEANKDKQATDEERVESFAWFPHQPSRSLACSQRSGGYSANASVAISRRAANESEANKEPSRSLSANASVARGIEILRKFSVPVGAVRITEEFFADETVSEGAVDAALVEIRRSLQDGGVSGLPDIIVGMGGTVTSLVSVKLGMKAYDARAVHRHVLSLDEVDAMIRRFCSVSLTERREIVGLQPKRAEVILGGACVVRALLDVLGASSFTVSDRGLRHALAEELFSDGGNV